jgi:hypothetical protein
MRVLVCGSRDYRDIHEMEWALEPFLNEDLVIIQGGARGADSLAKAYAETRYVPCEEYPADWKKYGRRAGFIRNKQMLDEGKPDLVIAFPGGIGTAMMVRLAEAAGVEVIRIEPIAECNS